MSSNKHLDTPQGQKGSVKFSKWRSFLLHVFPIAALLVFGAYLYHNADQYRQLLDLSADLLFLLIGLRLTFFFTNGLTNYLFYRGLNVPLGFNESIGLTAVNALANQLPFAGGLIVKGVYLKQRHRLTYTRFLSATLALYVCFLAANGVVGVAVLAYWALAGSAVAPTSLFLGFFVMTGSVLPLWLPLDTTSVPGKLGQQLTQLVEGWQVLSQDLLLLGKLVGLQMFTTLVFAGRYWIAFHMLSQDVTLAQCLLFSSATILTRLVSFAPGSLGVREGIVAGVASVLGFEAGISVVAVGIDRLIATLVTAVLGTVYAYILTRRLQKPPTEPGSDAQQRRGQIS